MRADPVVWLTLLGLVGCGALAALYPTETFTPEKAAEQAGRNVAVRLEVLSAQDRPGIASGTAAPLGAPQHIVQWVWFRPPEPGPHIGDQVIGRALVDRGDPAPSLVLDGTAAVVVPGPNAVPVRWEDLLAAPERYAGRLLRVNGHVAEGMVHDADGAARCPLDDDSEVMDTRSGAILLRLVRAGGGLSWQCHVEGKAT